MHRRLRLRVSLILRCRWRLGGRGWMISDGWWKSCNNVLAKMSRGDFFRGIFYAIFISAIWIYYFFLLTAPLVYKGGVSSYNRRNFNLLRISFSRHFSRSAFRQSRYFPGESHKLILLAMYLIEIHYLSPNLYVLNLWALQLHQITTI
jgi:hypothetical protein